MRRTEACACGCGTFKVNVALNCCQSINVDNKTQNTFALSAIKRRALRETLCVVWVTSGGMQKCHQRAACVAHVLDTFRGKKGQKPE